MIAAEVDGREFDDLDGGVNNPDAGAPGRRFRFWTDTELETAATPDHLVENLILSGSFALLVGAPGSMKSFVALDIAAAVQLGRVWAGHAVRRGPVLYVIAEGKGSFKLRTQAWKARHRHGGEIGIRFLTTPVQLAEPPDIGGLVAALGEWEEPPALIVIDTLARCAVGLNENSAQEMGLLIAGVDRLREATGAAVLLLHHTPRGEDRERGSVALRAATDTLLRCSVDGELVSVAVARQKDLDEGAPLAFRKHIVAVDAGATSCALEPLGTAVGQRGRRPPGRLTVSDRRVLEAIRAGGANTTVPQLAAAANCHPRTVARALRKLRETGLVERGAPILAEGPTAPAESSGLH